MREEAYADFTAKLIPTIDRSIIIGIRTPKLRTYAKQIVKSQEAGSFLQKLPHTYFEENLLHAMLICLEKDFDCQIDLLSVFLPYVDNWAVCDAIRSQTLKKHADKLPPLCTVWLQSDRPYIVRFGIEMLMCYLLDKHFDPAYIDMVASVSSNEYYVNMMISWYFATALAKQYDHALPVLNQNRLDTWTHNKTIQKAIESYRITDAQKAYLRTLKRKP